ncbi:MAG: hypothetical protein LBH43_11340 [Treponema sp.]|nr:hypothetical protein [Treponema sp.]
MQKSVYQCGGGVILSGDKPWPASYSIYKPAAASRMPAVYGASVCMGLGGEAFCGVRPALKISGT